MTLRACSPPSSAITRLCHEPSPQVRPTRQLAETGRALRGPYSRHLSGLELM